MSPLGEPVHGIKNAPIDLLHCIKLVFKKSWDSQTAQANCKYFLNVVKYYLTYTFFTVYKLKENSKEQIMFRIVAVLNNEVRQF